MSTFTNRLSNIGEFSVSQARFVILEVRGGLMRVVQTHDFSGNLLPEYVLAQGSGGRVNTSAALDSFPKGFIVPQTHQAFNAIKAQIQDVDSKVLTVCPQCQANGVTLQEFENACDSCVANMSTISQLKGML
jgi:hypothetical protein